MQRFRRTRGNGERVRGGLTGLAAIFLLVLAAAAGLRPDDRPAASAAAPAETLAVLGVAPGSGQDVTLRRQPPHAVPPPRSPSRI